MSDYGHDLEFGVFITPSNQHPNQVVALAELADQTGLDLVTFQDHPYQPRFLDAWTLLSFVAARTMRVRLAGNVLNLPLRPPAVLARAVASLDLLSGGRAELALGAGGFWDAIAAMGGRRLTPGESVTALEEAIAVIRALWDTGEAGGARLEGRFYSLAGARRGPAPLHPAQVWLGAYKPRMLRLVGRRADGWLPSLPYLKPGDLAAGNAAIDAAARQAGRDPAAIRRLLNLGGSFDGPAQGGLGGPPERWVEELSRLAVEDGIGTFIVMADDASTIRRYAEEVAPAVRAVVAARRAGARAEPPAPAPVVGEAPTEPGLGVEATPPPAERLSGRSPWDEAERPHRPVEPGAEYSERGRLVGRHLVDVHDTLRAELGELRQVLVQVREGVLSAAAARSELNRMALRQNDWTLGAFCSRYCGAVARHHSLEDESVFPHLAADPALRPVLGRLRDEHLVIHDAIQEVDRVLVELIREGSGHGRLQESIDYLTDALLSHLSYEEAELVEPLARLGFFPGQV